MLNSEVSAAELSLAAPSDPCVCSACVYLYKREPRTPGKLETKPLGSLHFAMSVEMLSFCHLIFPLNCGGRNDAPVFVAWNLS
jgi:hypothetical protein